MGQTPAETREGRYFKYTPWHGTRQLVLEDLAVVYFFLYLVPGRAQGLSCFGGVHV